MNFVLSIFNFLFSNSIELGSLLFIGAWILLTDACRSYFLYILFLCPCSLFFIGAWISLTDAGPHTSNHHNFLMSFFGPALSRGPR